MILKNTSEQLGYGDDAVLNLLKATIPTELYGTLYGHDNLYVVRTMLKDIYAKKPQNMMVIATRATQGATAPLTHICSPTRGAPKAQSDASLEDRILQFTDSVLHRPEWKTYQKAIQTLHNTTQKKGQTWMQWVQWTLYSIQWKTLSIRSTWKTTRTKRMLQI